MNAAKEDQYQKALERQMVRCEEACIKEVLKKYLGREATIEDAKLCGQIVSDPWDGTYKLLYNHILLGTVRYISESDDFRVEFIAIQKQN
jgi:hypothetical protein